MAFYCNGDEVEFGSPTVNEFSIEPINLKQQMPAYLLDGFGCTNYFDAEYNIANATTFSGVYRITPINYLPSGTYTISSCSNVTTIGLDGTKNTISSGSYNAPVTFALTEDVPYYQATIHGNYIANVKITRSEPVKNGYCKYTLDNFDTTAIEFYPTHWNGKTYVAIGDSITRGYAPGNTELGIVDGSQIANCYAIYTGKALNLKTHNIGFDGATIRNTMANADDSNTTLYKILNKTSGIEPDVLTIMLGANDISNGIGIGAIEDVYTSSSNCTFIGGVKELVNRIQTAFPACTIILIGEPATTSRGAGYDDYRNALKTVAEYFNVLYLDFSRGTCLNLNSQTSIDYFQLNQIHPNFRAHEIMGKRLTGFIASH